MLCSSLRFVSKSLSRFSLNSGAFKRHFLSAAFQCEDSWRKRLETPLLKKCVLEDFYFELDNKFSQNEDIAPIDVDIFVNAITDWSHLDEMQDLVHKLRLSREACNILPSTHHALIRALLDCKKFDDLMTILNDRLNYGIFPDEYSSILMFDVFLKLEDYKNAAKVATFQMLQEDFDNNLIRHLSLYSCHKYLLNPTQWEKPKEQTEPEDDGEERKVRVAYLRNPYFDDHFDLSEANDLIGKTLVMIGQQTNDEISISYQLLGYILYKKFSSAQSLLNTIIENKQSIHKDIFELINKCLEEMKQVKPEDTNDTNIKSVEDLANLVQNLVSKNLVSESQALPIVEQTIKQIVKESEPNIISQQQTIYQEWIENRETILKETLDNLKKEDRLAEVQRVKEELARREQQLFFFDREDQLDLEIERKEQLAREEKALSASAQNKGTVSPDDYVPPEIVKQKRTD